MRRLDHLVCAAPALAQGVAWLEERLGVRATRGGRHPAWGTENALVGLSVTTYLEILAPDPEAEPTSLTLRLEALDAPRLLTWAAKSENLEAMVARAAGLGVDLMKVRAGNRRRPDGSMLSWTLTDLSAPRLDGLVPFFIDWGASPHPAASLPTACTLIGLEAEHPQATRVRDVLAALDLDLAVQEAPRAALIAQIDSPRGIVELR